MPNYILYGHRESGHSYKVRLALELLDAAHEYRDVDVFAPRDSRGAEWKAVSRFGEVPVLSVDGRTIVQSNAILLHLAREYHALGWDIDPDRLTEWLFWEANRIGISQPILRWQLHLNPLGDPGPNEWLRERLECDLSRLDEELRTTPFLMGKAVSAADIACCGYLFFADQVQIEIGRWPDVSIWQPILHFVAFH